MRGRWFRLYDEVVDDPKVQSLPAEDFRGWINLLCLANRNDGRLPSIEAIAFGLRMDVIGAGSLIDRLSIAGLIDKVKGGHIGWAIAPHAWDKRQYKSDTSTERVKRFRNASKTVTVTPSETETESSSSLRSEEECSSSVPSEELLASQPKSAKKPRASKSTSGPFNPTLLPLPVFVLWKAIVELRWRDDGVPEKHAREAAEVATWLYEKRNATTDDLVNWVRWWWKHPDSMGARQGSRPWPTNVKNSWDTCFLAPSAPDAGMTPAQKAGAEARRKGALVQAELDRRKAERERGLLT